MDIKIKQTKLVLHYFLKYWLREQNWNLKIFSNPELSSKMMFPRHSKIVRILQIKMSEAGRWPDQFWITGSGWRKIQRSEWTASKPKPSVYWPGLELCPHNLPMLWYMSMSDGCSETPLWGSQLPWSNNPLDTHHLFAQLQGHRCISIDS